MSTSTTRDAAFEQRFRHRVHCPFDQLGSVVEGRIFTSLGNAFRTVAASAFTSATTSRPLAPL